MKKLEDLNVRRCKYKGCNRLLRENNKSGYCYNHFHSIY